MTAQSVALGDGVSCSAGSAAAGEPMAGTAPQAVAWLALEQRGPWGPKALTQSHLDPALGRTIEAASAEHGIRPSLIRHVGRHPDDHDHTGDYPRRLLLASTTPGRSWLLEGALAEPERVMDVDWGALAAGDADAVLRSLPELRAATRPRLLVCTNGTRDVCCATKGRPVALGVARRFPDRTWEVTHTSGHRFAATSVLLPAGTVHGRLDVARAVDVLLAADRGETVLQGSRGRSTWQPAGQAAELAVREKTGERGLDALAVTAVDPVPGDGHRWVSRVRHVDGRAWEVETHAREAAVARAESCGKALKPLVYLSTTRAA